VSCSLTVEQDQGEIDDVADGDRSVDKLFSAEQEALVSAYANVDFAWSELAVLGPVEAWVWELEHEDIASGLTVELWVLPDGTEILEVSTRTSASKAEATATKLNALLEDMGLDTSSDQETKTRAALDYFAAEAR
jgi:hypothetical protein